MIRVKELHKTFDTPDGQITAIDNVSFHVDRGQVYGIIGLSGAGKSTVVRCLNMLEVPTYGTVEIDGKVLNDLSKKELLETRRDIGMIFQHFNLFDQRNVAENVAYPLEIIGLSKEEIDTRVDEMLEFVGLLDRKNAYPSQLSGGQKQRVAIARALGTRPKILLSDESTSALDPANTEVVLNLLKQAVKKYNMTVVMITHQMEVAKDICDRIAVMENGKIIEEDTVEEIFNNPKTNRTRSFIDKLPEISGRELDPKDYEGMLLRLNFREETAASPVVNTVMKESKCLINILSGNLSRIKGKATVGYLLVELQGDKADCIDAIEQFNSRDVRVEVL